MERRDGALAPAVLAVASRAAAHEGGEQGHHAAGQAEGLISGIEPSLLVAAGSAAVLAALAYAVHHYRSVS